MAGGGVTVVVVVVDEVVVAGGGVGTVVDGVGSSLLALGPQATNATPTPKNANASPR